MKKNTTSKKTNSKVKKSSKKKSSFSLILLVILCAIVFAFAWQRGYVSVDFGEDGKPFVVLNLPFEIPMEESTSKPVSAEVTQKPSAAAVKSDKPLDESAVPGGAENSALYFGNPSGAVADISVAANYLIEHPQYTMSYNAEKYIPNWVSWHLEVSDIGASERADDFRPDSSVPSGYYAVKKSDYQYTKYGFDRGHVCPSADRTATNENNSMTFLMTNMIPQSPDCNRVVWKDFEAYERELARNGKEVYIVAGPDGVGGTSGTGTWESIDMLTGGKPNGKKITVPAYCWKIVLVLDEGEDDISRVTEDTTVIAVYMPNAMGIGKNGSWEQYLVSVDYIEEKTGYDFLAPIPDSIENVIEAKVYSR